MNSLPSLSSPDVAAEPGLQPAVLQLEHVTKIYQRHGAHVLALCDIDVLIRRGEFVAIMGRSGSGKSTLLHIMGLLDGEVVSGLPLDELARLRNRKIGFVFQSFHLLPQLSILENAELPALYAGRDPAECRVAAQARLEQMGLGHRLEHKPLELSIGQRQRAAIARSLVNEPAVLLADEPTGALDSRTASEILDILHDLHREGATVVLVTHDHEVGETAERIIHIADGQTNDGVA